MTYPIIELCGLIKQFTQPTGALDVLNGIDLSIQPGEIYGIIGLSGAGKSTLVRCINYLEEPTSGKVFFDGQDVGEMNLTELSQMRRQMGMIFQQFNLLMQSTVAKNISFPLEIAGWKKSDTQKRVKELLELVDLLDKEKAYPSQLSGGQKQRVAIARALALGPKVLLCDEATSALDPATTLSILDLLREINRDLGITILIITHEMSVVKHICSHVAVIDGGDIVEKGPVEQLFKNPAHRATRQLVSPEGDKIVKHMGAGCYRLVFDGISAYRPIIAELARDCKVDVNILYANTENIDGSAMGQMIVTLGNDQKKIEKALEYLKNQNVFVEGDQEWA